MLGIVPIGQQLTKSERHGRVVGVVVGGVVVHYHIIIVVRSFESWNVSVLKNTPSSPEVGSLNRVGVVKVLGVSLLPPWPPRSHAILK